MIAELMKRIAYLVRATVAHSPGQRCALMLTAALGDERVRISCPVAEPLRAKLVRSLPDPRIAVGAIEVKQGSAAARNPVASPLQGLGRPAADEGEERIQPANLVNVFFELAVSPAFDSLARVRMLVEGERGEYACPIRDELVALA